MAGPFLSRDYTHYVQLETVYDTSPGALSGQHAFKSRTEFPFERVKARLDRDRDTGDTPSVITTQGGRESSTWKIEGDLVPSDNATTPTPPDMDPFFEAHFGSKHTATAHAVTAAASSGTTLNLGVGAGAASGLQIGDILAVDVSTADGYESRRVQNIVGDVVTVDRAFTIDPPVGRAVKVGTTYRFSAPEAKTLHLWEFLSGDNFRQRAGGCTARQLTLGCDFAEDVPVGTVSFEGDGAAIAPHTTTEPTAVTAGLPLVPVKSYIWVGEDKHCLCKFELNSDNGLELRNNTSCTSVPTGVKRTGNSGRYNVTLQASILLETGSIESYYDSADDLAAYSIILQLGVTPGSIVVITCPKFIPDVPVEAIDGEVALNLTGRCYGVTGDDEISLAFL
jgi:hypothetical protein